MNNINKPIGRPKNDISIDVNNYIKNYTSKANVGYKKLTKISQRDPNSPKDITEWKVRKVYEKEDLYVFLHEYKPDPKQLHPHAFVARYVGQAWHTDLHYLEILNNESQKYLIAFLDDRSRKIVHYEILDDKSSIATSNALLNALSKNLKPKMIIFDNGKEFVSEQFLRILNNNNIEYHRTHPYTPEENGKIERFWKTIEIAKKFPLRNPYLHWLIDQYNNNWSNESLEKLTNKSICTPEDAWNLMIKFDGQEDADFIYETN